MIVAKPKTSPSFTTLTIPGNFTDGTARGYNKLKIEELEFPGLSRLNPESLQIAIPDTYQWGEICYTAIRDDSTGIFVTTEEEVRETGKVPLETDAVSTLSIYIAEAESWGVVI
ncbi:hypothetical protein K3495_g8181 [Podosphaera aphanis]|nr:hypothetical protein K3495_g8181 [Podosphaera aphanis]